MIHLFRFNNTLFDQFIVGLYFKISFQDMKLRGIYICLFHLFKLSLYLMELMMPIVIQLLFLCLCLFNFTVLVGKCFVCS